MGMRVAWVIYDYLMEIAKSTKHQWYSNLQIDIADLGSNSRKMDLRLGGGGIDEELFHNFVSDFTTVL